MKIIFWGSSDFSMKPLEALAGEHEILAVVTNADACCGRGMKEIRMTPVKQFALEREILVLQPVNLKDEHFQAQLRQLPADLSVTASYGMILPESLLSIPVYGSINLHASLLPAYRGASPVQAALAHGDRSTGNTIQYMAKKMDAGDIILQSNTDIGPDETYPELLTRLSADGATLLLKACSMIEAGTAPRDPQNHNAATYCGLIRKEDGKISFVADTAHEIYNKWRAFTPWPGIHAEYANEPYCRLDDPKCITYFGWVKPIDWPHTAEPGTILEASRGRLIIQCREGALEILRIKPAGKKEMDAQSFLNGYRPQAGSKF